MFPLHHSGQQYVQFGSQRRYPREVVSGIPFIIGRPFRHGRFGQFRDCVPHRFFVLKENNPKASGIEPSPGVPGLDGLGALKTLIDALNDISVAGVLTTAMTESYAAKGAAPTLAQAILMILQERTEFVFAGTTKTVKKIDGAATAATLTLDDDTDPTSLTRAT